MTRRTLKFTCKKLDVTPNQFNEVEVEVEAVDVTDFLDAEMAVEELNRDDLLNCMDPGDVADWLRGEGYHVEEE